MNNYRINKAPRDTIHCPIGMNSLIWLGDGEKKAIATYLKLRKEMDTNIILSKWNDSHREYVIIRGTTLTETVSGVKK